MSSYVEITKYNIAKEEEEKKSVVNLWLDCTIIDSILLLVLQYILQIRKMILKKKKKKKRRGSLVKS